MKITRRKEFKYIISYADYFKLQPMLASLLIHDLHGDKMDYPIHSIYLDDLVFTGASDKTFGIEVHKKYRIRYYHDVNKKKLELKQKIGDDSTKYSTWINNELYKGIIDGDLNILHKYIDDDVVRRFLVDHLKRHLKPKVKMTYQREAYKDETDNLRITFDKSLCGELFMRQLGESTEKLLNSHVLILEVKYEHFLPKHIKDILKQINLDQTAYSKYYYGYARSYQ